MVDVFRQRFLRFFGTAHVAAKLERFLFWKFHWVWRDVEGTPQIIKQMAD